ncbi:MAG: hypothetical protein AAGB00_11955, partial [Planctomycetota bacterium]
PDFVTVAGDLVMARWWQDGNGAFETFTDGGQTITVQTDPGDGVFGPKLGDPGYASRDLATEQARVVNASDFYYDVWNQRFDDRDLPVYVAVGDHELGDDPSWANEWGKQTTVTYREQFAKHFVDQYGEVGNTTDQAAALASNTLAAGSTLYSKPASGQHKDTAYAIQHNNALIVSVDQFKRDTANNGITVTVADEQLAWLEQTLEDANNDPTIDHIFVQGHTTVITPVASRWSGGLKISGQTDSDFWGALRDAGADLYLSGEVHDVTVNQDAVEPSLLQISHGGIFGFPNVEYISYLKGTVDGDVIELEMKTLGTQISGDQFYQPGNPGTRLQTNISLTSGQFETVGTVTMDTSQGATQYSNATGVFANLGTPPEPSLGTYSFNSTGANTAFVQNRSVSQQPEDATFSEFGAVGVQIATSGGQNFGRFSAGNNWPGTFPFVPDGSDFDDGKYMHFLLTADEGYLIDADEIALDWNRGGQKSVDDGIMRVSSDGFATFEEFTLFTNVSRTFSDSDVSMTIDLSGFSLSESLEFRFYFKDENIDPTGAPWARLDNVAVRAEIVLAATPGDYNGDGFVNAADYTVFRDNLGGSADVLAAGSRDSSLTGVVGAADYLFWRSSFVAASAAASFSEAGSVPAPAAGIAGVLAAFSGGMTRTGRRRVAAA